MIISLLQRIHQFWRWWKSTLLSCLPEAWLRYLTTVRSNFDLVVTRRGSTVFLLNRKGSIIDSIDLESQTPHRNDINLDIVLNDEMTVFDENEPQSGLESQADINNVVALSRNNDNDITIQIDYQDQPAGTMDTALTFGQDSTIVNESQGNLIQFDTTSADIRETTQLFRSDGGKIRKVDTADNDISESRSLPAEQAAGEATSENLAEYQAVIKLLEKYQGRKKCLYLLPENRVLVLNLSYPAEVAQNVENILTYDLEKHIPLSFSEIRYFYALQSDDQHKQVNVEVAVIKSDEYDLLSLSLNQFLNKGLVCTTERFLQKYGRKINFLEIEAESNWLSVLKLRNIHLALNWILIFTLLLVPLTILYQKVQQQTTNTPAEIEKFKQIMGSFSDLDSEVKFRTRLFEQINRSPKAVELLTVLSSNINSEAWLTQFSLKNGEIKLKGEAASATSVSDDLSNTGLFQSIKFVSSIVKNPQSGKETFELLMVLNSDE